MTPTEACDVIESALRLVRRPTEHDVERIEAALAALAEIRAALAVDRNATEAWPSV